MKLGILGGTFDPIHKGHIELAKNAQAQFLLDKVLLIPVFDPPHKQSAKPFASARDRAEMVRRAVCEETSLELSEYEIRRQGISYTIETLTELEKQYPGAEFYLILGQDSLQSIDSWNSAAEIKKKVVFIAAKRQTASAVIPSDVKVEWISMPLLSVSASGIRKAIARGDDVSQELHPEVLAYIQGHHLYGSVPCS